MTRPRRQAREAALQVLYFCEVGRTTPDEALDAYFAGHRPDAAPLVRAFAADLVRGTVAAQASLDELIGRHAEHWRVDRLAVVDRIVLRMAAWELQHVTATPPAVVINEAIELARAFGTAESARFVNGVLDSIRRALGREV
ncbi:MAG TPA: transcription antitermination factor NusB [Vicinamibacterales bacterium]|nr:transcription antitermination factor NusB [Vicinamibacterales bacterium]